MSKNEINEGSDKVERINQGDRTSENTSSDSVIGGNRQDHQKIHQKAREAGQTFGTFSDNDDDQSMQAVKPGETAEQYQTRLALKKEQESKKPKVDPFGIDFGDGTVETSKGKIETTSDGHDPLGVGSSGNNSEAGSGSSNSEATTSKSTILPGPQEQPYRMSQAAEAADGKTIEHWNPSKEPLNLLDKSSWSKIQMYAVDVGRANGWEGIKGGDQWIKVNALRHALATAYITYNYGALSAISAGNFP
ncbi:MAG: hypothetical protein K8F91_12625 [Candidatus Obscuribacterales bacterium]|nr:hypothetical protein [Candidatus Obscuribacterales bacterium]